MKLTTYITALFVLCCSMVQAQMWNGVDSLYGNEWINFDQTYYKIKVAEDKVYRIPYQTLSNLNIPLNEVEGGQFQLFYMGEEIPIHVSNDGVLSNNDYIEFYGKKNRSELDRYLFSSPDTELLNPRYSLFNDTSAYFLTWTNTGNAERFEAIDNDLNNPPAAESSFLYEQRTDYSARWHKSIRTSGDVSSEFGMSEGFGQSFQNQQSFSLTPEFLASGANEVELSMRLTTDAGSHDLEVKVNGTTYAEEVFFNYRVLQFDFEIPVSGASPSLNVELEGRASNGDRHAISNIILKYPRTFNFDGQNLFAFNIKSGDEKYIEISNFNHSGGTPILYDLTNQQRLVTTVENNIVKVVLPASSVDRALVLFNNNSGFETITATTEVNFIDYSNENPGFLIISNKRLFNDGQGNNYVQDYADYRSAAEGGSYNVLIAEIQQIYDQFAYGIDRHNIAVRNFANYGKKEWEDWKYALLLGKSREYREYRTTEQINEESNQAVFLPTYSAPGSDVLMFAPMNSRVPVVPVGRLAAENTREVRIYLDKLKAYELAQKTTPQTLEEKKWMKRIMHLGGGADAAQQNLLRNHLEYLGNILVESKFGAELTSFYKTSTDPIQVSQSEELTNTINNGVSMITFFGHSSPTGFDFALDNPENYGNIDKYPIISSYGCFAGAVHAETKSIGETFIFVEQKGAIGFFASIGQGYINDLRNFGEYFYNQTGNNSYGSTVGEIHKKTIRNFQSVGGTFKDLIQQTIYQGDPAIRINPQPGPDFIVDTKSVEISPSPINVDVVDTMTVSFDIVNIGVNNKDSVLVKIEQELPSGELVLLQEQKLYSQAFRDHFSFKFPTQGEKSIGKNLLHIFVDSNDEVEEAPAPDAEINNELVSAGGIRGLPFFAFSNDARPLYPTRFGITSDRNVVLKASTTNTFISNQKYIVQIDTTENFNSASKQETFISQEGGVIKWQPTIDYEDNRVYYWRISPDSTLTEGLGYLWQNSSFLFLNEVADGWNQSHYFQYIPDEYENMRLEENRKFAYSDNIYSIEVENSPWPFGPRVLVNNAYNQEASSGSSQLRGGVFVTVIDGASGLFMENIDGTQFGSDLRSESASGVLENAFTFRVDSLQEREELINFLSGPNITDGDYVIVATMQHTEDVAYFPHLWAADSIELGTNLFQVLESHGATKIREIENEILPYTFVFRKGDSSFQLKEDIGMLTTEESLSVMFDAAGFWDRGSIFSTLIGPATDWGHLFWGSKDFDTEFDREKLVVYGVDKNGQQARLIDNISDNDLSLTAINASDFPYLQLEYATSDSLKRTPPQLDYWRVYYTGIPEASLDKSALFEFYADTLQQGETLRFRIAAENVSDYNMDSLLVKYTITAADNSEEVVKKRFTPLLKGDTLITSLRYNTKNLLGRQTLTIEINPDEDQPEQFFINNVGFVNFFVEKDKRNPNLDVTFDGLHIMDGDIVSPDPLIVIEVEDENQYLALSDTALFEVFLIYPDDPSPREISLTASNVQFYPANLSAGKNKASIEFSPVFEEDGIYRLMVRSKDATGNHSGNFAYEIDFEVITDDMISNVLNYPNPFSTATHFVYTLTGHAPEFFRIQILTVSGRVVKEITQDDLGQLKVGTHQTEYVWDGTDEFGDKLANGVYLYRITAKDAEGNDYDTFSTQADGFFKNNFGKLVILR